MLENQRAFWFLKPIFLSSCNYLQTVYNCCKLRGILHFNFTVFLHSSSFKAAQWLMVQAHGFQDTVNLLCSCGNDIESTEYFLLPFPLFLYERRSLLSTLGKFKYSLLENISKVLKQFFLELFQLVEPITPRFFMLQLILSYRVKYLIKSFFRYQKL